MLVNVDDRTISADYKMNRGFHIGTTVEFPISEVFFIESAVLLTTIGYRESRTNTVTNFSYEYKNWKKLLYLDFPVTGIVTGDIGKVNVYGVIGSNLVLTKSEK
ncbi:MAG: hypothetical protein KAQ79_17400 [Cyclobacteriaceae bacterium]|nr:hypothetical protein [Cyclobacteriaceae bacterium]